MDRCPYWLAFVTVLAAGVPVSAEEIKERTRLGESAGVRSLAFSPDGKTLAVSYDNKTVILWDTTTGKHRHVLGGGKDDVGKLAFSPDGGFLAGRLKPGVVRVWDVSAGKETVSVKTGIKDDFSEALALGLKGQLLAVGDDSCRVLLFDTASGRKLSDLDLGGRDVKPITHTAFSPDGKTLGLATYFILHLGVPYQMRLGLFDIQKPGTPKRIGEWIDGGKGRPGALRFSPDGKTLAAVGDRVNSKYGGPRLLSADTGKGKQLAEKTINKELADASQLHEAGLCYAARGPVVASLIWEEKAKGVTAVVFWDGGTGNELGRLDIAKQPIRRSGMEITADGKMLATVHNGETGIVRLWDTEGITSPR
jgi:WD40 repeat protein